MNYKLKIILLVGTFVGCAQAGLVVDRGLPVSNLNFPAGANRSNISWGYDNQFFSGDDFSLAAGAWRVDAIRIWTVNGGITEGSHLGTDFSSVSLYGGPAAAGVALLATGTLSASSDSSGNPNITITPVTYTGGASYQ